MNRWLFMLMACCLLAALPSAAGALTPAHNYDCSDTTPTAYDARVDQAAISYDSSSSTNALASVAYNQFRSDAIFFFNGHGLYYDDSHKGGRDKVLLRILDTGRYRRALSRDLPVLHPGLRN